MYPHFKIGEVWTDIKYNLDKNVNLLIFKIDSRILSLLPTTIIG